MSIGDGRVISNFIVQALKNKNIMVCGDGSQIRSFQFIDDPIEGMTKMINNKYIDPVNLGNPEELTINEIALKVLKMIPNSKSKIVYKDLPKDNPIRRKPDINLAKEKLNWEPKIKLEEGLEKNN